MAICCSIRSAGLGVLLVSLLAGAGCSRGGSARTDHFTARSIAREASPGDGTVIAFGPEAQGAAWTAQLSFAPTLASSDLAAADKP